MILPRLTELRLYYNTTVRPELLRLEWLRKRILYGVAVSLIGIVAVVWLFLWFDLGFLLLLFVVPMAFFIGSLWWRLRGYRRRFKPVIVGLLLDFINQTPNVRELTYEAEGVLNADRFERSGLFRPHPDSYRAEDYIRGIVGEMAFEMGEAYVQEISPASNRLQLVFSGLFVHARFNEDVRGRVAVWPRSRLRRMKRSVDAFVGGRGRNADVEIMNEGFRETFATYAQPGTKVHSVLTPPIQDAMLAMTRTQGRDLYFSVIDRDLFIGLEHDYDVLEPHLFRSNVSFKLIRQFYGDIMLMLSIIEGFDQGR